MFSEKFSNQEKPKFSVFDETFAEMNQDFGYSFSELSGHNPNEGVWKIQLHESIDSNVPENAIALSNEKNEAYANLLRTALETDSDNEYLVTSMQSPSIHIKVEALPR